MNEFLRLPRKVVLWIIAALTFAATAASLGESYHALWLWAIHHQFGGNWGFVWPLQIDTFIAIGEAALFVGLVDMWQGKKRVFPWAVAIIGLAVSVAANVGHVSGNLLTTRLTAAVPPIAAWASLVVGMGVLKRVVDLYDQKQKTSDFDVPKTTVVTPPVTPDPEPEVPVLAATPPRVAAPRRPYEEVLEEAKVKFAGHIEAEAVPTLAEIRTEVGVGQARAQQLREDLAELTVPEETRAHLAEVVADFEASGGKAELDPGSDVTSTHAHPPAYQALPLTPVKQ